MDKCVMEDKDITTCNLTGQFVPVSAFLEMLELAKRLGWLANKVHSFCAAGVGTKREPVVVFTGTSGRGKSNGGVNTEHEKLCPSFVFQGRTKKSENSSLNLLSEKAVSDVVRININVQDEDNNIHRFIYATPSKDNKMLSFEGVA
ncbi:hypothetical protein PC119_g15449 [Phytophthora cactorum]|uniref:Uncharacterized protein n=1 Tax=Phytophthora cactorum TaxID=29920 RepID=A0A8T1CP56_9STRA|nr:hypothetical protein PC117_g15195 [Phytophthora cactorum]KAG3004923.1 hypothetical protein PC119_g15449 [Phytophthora cactorum]KAG3194388.1 hypothetical protein PC128_g9405 [Phytophthora cactorum]